MSKDHDLEGDRKGRVFMVGGEHIEFKPGDSYLRSVFLRRRWWQLWRPKRLWLVLHPSRISYNYEVELYNKHKPAHKKLMDELGKLGFTTINFRGIPFVPDEEKDA